MQNHAQVHNARILQRSVVAPEDRAKLTNLDGKLVGRSTLRQQEILGHLGVERARSVRWTAYRAQQEIEKRSKRQAS